MNVSLLNELENKLRKANSVTEKVTCYLEMASMLKQSDVEHAIELAYNAKALSEDENDQLNLARCLNALGSCYWYKADYTKSLHYLSQASEEIEDLSEPILESKIFNNLGNVYRDIGNLSSAMNAYRKALGSSEKINDEHTMAVVLKNISNLHIDLYEYDKALEYALRSKTLFEKHNSDSLGLVSLYITLGNIYFKKDSYNEALQYFYKCIEISDIDTQNNTLAAGGLGKVYFKMKEYAKAENYLVNALEVAQKFGHVETLIIAIFYLGRIHFEKKDYISAVEHLFEALQISTQYNRKHDMMSVHEVLVQVYEKQENYKQAYWHLTEFEKLKNEIFEKNKIEKLSEMRMGYELELALREKQIAQQTAQLKQQFMANMSHEIRTPMNAIIGLTRLLQDKPHLPEQEKYLSAISRSADNLLVIINDILDLSKIEAGKIVLENVPFYIEDVVKDIVEVYDIKAREKNLDLYWHIESEVPRVLIGDPTRLGQVLINLVSNALKFTENGSVKIHAKLIKRNQHVDKKTIVFEVTDTGIGISEDYVKKIFDSFTQAGSDTARKYGGTGLGLTISKELVELMKGKIGVRSKLGVGTTFYFELPFDAAAGDEIVWQNQSQDHQVQDVSKLKYAKILLVEDNEFNRLLAEDSLKEFSDTILVDTAENGVEAIEKLKANNYDLILMDIQMPVMDGMQATMQIRKLPKPLGDIKIIAMTANVFREDIEKYMSIGMNAYVSKPFKKDSLLQTLIQVLNDVDVQVPDTLPIEATLGSSSEDLPVCDLSFLTNFTKGDKAKQAKYINMFLDNAPKLLGTAAEYLAQKDFASMKTQVHALKSQLNYMGVKEEVSHVQELEQACLDVNQHHKIESLFQNLQKISEKSFRELKDEINKFVLN